MTENLQEELPFPATGQIGMWFAEHALEHVLLHLIGHRFGGVLKPSARRFMSRRRAARQQGFGECFGRCIEVIENSSQSLKPEETAGDFCMHRIRAAALDERESTFLFHVFVAS